MTQFDFHFKSWSSCCQKVKSPTSLSPFFLLKQNDSATKIQKRALSKLTNRSKNSKLDKFRIFITPILGLLGRVYDMNRPI